MACTVIQTDQTSISVDQLVNAFEAIDRLTRADAMMLARQTFGFYYQGLEAEEAHALKNALESQGVPAAIVDDADLYQLPDGKTFKRLDPTDEGLIAYDVMGRPRTVAWGNVLVVAAGYVRAIQVEKHKRTVRGGGVGLAYGGGLAMPMPSAPSTEITHRGKETTRLLLEIIVNDDIGRYRADGAELLYLYLGSDRRPRCQDNFPRLVADLVSHASVAMLNQGAVSIVAAPDDPLIYPTRRPFEREITWLIWSGAHGS
ncbi:MAG: hypothetical protein WD042_13125 [Phycisphaeraceae bacterium]